MFDLATDYVAACPTWRHFVYGVATVVVELVHRLLFLLRGDSLTALQAEGRVYIPDVKPTCIVTGSNAGLGKEAAKALAQFGYHVILACRNPQKALAAKAEIDETLKANGGTGQVSVYELDLTSFASVSRFCDKILKDDAPLHLLVNNAGVVAEHSETTQDGLELAWQTNQVSPFLLTQKLLPKLCASHGRVVMLGSCMHWPSSAKAVLQAMDTNQRVNSVSGYCRSKLGNILFGRELAKQEENVSVYIVHPGICMTQMLDKSLQMGKNGLLAQLMYHMAIVSQRVCFKTPAEGARGTIYASVLPPNSLPSGTYIVDAMPAALWNLSEDASNDQAAEELWTQCQKMVAGR